MKRKGIFTILAAVFMVLTFSAMALAANQVFLKTTVPNIPKSTCYQAGTDTMEFDSLTKIEDGDIIQFTLNNGVTICKAIDMFVTIAPNTGVLDTTGNLPVSTTAGSVTPIVSAAQWGFRVQAPADQQIITLTLRQVATGSGVLSAIVPGNIMQFTGTLLTDKLVVKLFDGKAGTPTSADTFSTSGIHKYTVATTAYDTQIAASDNALCINTLTPVEYMGEYVQNTPNSIPVAVIQKLNFSGDYTIAHIMTAQTYNLVTCKGATCGSIVLGKLGQTNSCTSFDYETIGTTSGNPYCTDHTADTTNVPGNLPKFIIQTSQEFQNVPYTVTAEIRVNGVAGEHGVYWSASAPLYKTSDVTTCGTAVGANSFTGVTYLKADGSTPVTTPHAAGANTCADVKTAEKAVSFKTAAQNLFIPGQFFFELNLPPFVYNFAEVNVGDVVSVHVTLSKATCGSFSFDLCMGTFVAKCPVDLTKLKATCILPFVPSLASGDTYWSGVAISNNSSNDGTVKLTAYKKDGTSATATVTIPSKKMVSGFVYDTATFPWTGTTPAGVPAYIQLDSTGFEVLDLNAFVFMSDSISTTDSNSMGYTCVKP